MAIKMRFENRSADYGTMVVRNVGVIGGAALIALTAGLGAASFRAGTAGGWGMLATASLGCFAVGAGFGFLFSIPRSVQGSGNPDGTSETLPTGKRAVPRDNTNLEQISDWLVKILIGAGLAQVRSIREVIVSVSRSLGSGLGHPGESVAAEANTQFCMFLLVYSLAVGFLAGYLITRLWLPFVMLRTSLALEFMTLEVDERVARQEGAEKALGAFGLLAKGEHRPAGDAAAGNRIRPSFDADPNKGKFGGSPSAGGLTLTGEAAPIPGVDDYFRVRLKVFTDGQRTLTQPVTIHLHPTFTPSEVEVLPVDNTVVLERAAWGAFTVGVTIKGEETMLELDLAELPNAPEKFRKG